MKVGDIIELDILSNGMDGEGVARVDGMVVFVPYTLMGERVRAKVVKVKRSYAVCSCIKVLSPSEHRKTPSCPHYYKCGGCDMGHVDPEYRQKVLIDELKNNLNKIADIDAGDVEFIRSPEKRGLRNKLSMPFGLSNGKVILGLYKQNTHAVQPVECGMSGSIAQTVSKIVCDFANSKKLSVYDFDSGRGLLRHLVVREIGGRASVTLVINGQSFDGEKALSVELPDTVDFFVCPNTKRNNVIMGDSVRLVRGKPRLDIDVMGVKAKLSPLSFLQVNDYIRDRLYSDVIGALSSPVLVDLFSGIGITSNLAANAGKTVTAVECVPQAVRDADETAKLNGNADKIKNVCGKVEDVIGSVVDGIKDFDVLIDPPRKGCGEGVMQAIANCKPNKLIYVSCNHATMCRDIRAFLDASPDYEIIDLKLYDMFPNTHHTETLICLTRN